jgi:hypothetical protein
MTGDLYLASQVVGLIYILYRFADPFNREDGYV